MVNLSVCIVHFQVILGLSNSLKKRVRTEPLRKIPTSESQSLLAGGNWWEADEKGQRGKCCLAPTTLFRITANERQKRINAEELNRGSLDLGSVNPRHLFPPFQQSFSDPLHLLWFFIVAIESGHNAFRLQIWLGLQSRLLDGLSCTLEIYLQPNSLVAKWLNY